MLKNKIKYVVFLALLLLLAILYNNRFTLLIFVVFCVMPFLLLVSNLYTKRHLSFVFSIEPPVISRGVGAVLHIEMKNNAWLPVTRMKLKMTYRNRYCGEAVSEDILLSIDSRSVQNAAIDINSEYNGNIEFCIQRVYIYDIFRIWRSRLDYEERRVVTVLPELLAICDEIPARNRPTETDADEYSISKSGDDVSELFDVREYRPGDQYKRMHRKLSMKHDKLYIKEFGLPVDCSIVMMADFRHTGDVNGTLRLFDRIVTILYSLGAQLLDGGQMFYMVWYDKNTLLCQRERVDCEETLLEVISLIYESSPRVEECPIAKQYMASYPHGTCLSLLYIGGEDMLDDYVDFCNGNISIREKHAFLIGDGGNNPGWRIVE